jgi:hypothetical protein
MNSTIGLSSILVISFLLGSCGSNYEHCNIPPDTARYVLSPSEKQIVPYTNDQVLTFVDTANEEFTVQVKREEHFDAFNFRCHHFECCDNYKNAELVTYEFISERGNLFPLIVTSKYTPSQGAGTIAFLGEYETQLFRTESQLDLFGRLGFDENLRLECADFCKDGVTIRDQTYPTINRVYSAPFSAADEYSIYYYYFTADKGILKIEKENYQKVNNQSAVVSTEEFVWVK